MDAAWWKTYKPEFAGEKLTSSDNAQQFATVAPSVRGENSGAGAMLLARHRGSEKIILLGFDCKPAPCGKRHWHGAHKGKLGNAGSMDLWQGQFMRIFDLFKDIDVVNCSRDTALNLWPKRDLEAELC